MSLLKLFLCAITSTILLSNCLRSQAQQPTIMWEKKYGYEKNDEAFAIKATKDDNLLIIGYTQPKERYDLDLLLMKVDTNGEVIWEQKYGDESVEVGYDAIELEDGSWMILAMKSTVDKGNDIYLLKINKMGEMIWSNQYGGKNNDNPKSMILTEDNNLLITGMKDTDGIKDGFPVIVPYAFMLKLDLDGKEIWTQLHGSDNVPLKGVDTYSIEKGEAANKIIQTKDGGYLLAGHTMTKPNGGFATDAWLCKTDFEGNKEWTKSFGAVGGDDLLDVLEDSNGDYFVVGERYDKPKKRISLWLNKFNSNGNHVFEQFYNMNDICFGGKAIFYDDKNILLVSSTKRPDTKWIRVDSISMVEKGDYLFDGFQIINYRDTEYLKKDYLKTKDERIDLDLYLVLTNKEGKQLWQQKTGGLDDEKPLAICKTKNNEIFIAAYTNSDTKGLKDILLIKIK